MYELNEMGSCLNLGHTDIFKATEWKDLQERTYGEKRDISVNLGAF